MKCPGKGLERILPLVGLDMKDAMLIMSDSIVSERLFYSAIRGVVDMKNFEAELMEHINGCDNCRASYNDYFSKEQFPK